MRPPDYTDASINSPQGIASGPDGALWFTNNASSSIGRIIRPRTRSPTTPAPGSVSRRGSRPGPTGRCGSPTTATARSGGSPPAARSPTTPEASVCVPRQIAAGSDGALWFTDFCSSIGRIIHHARGHQLHGRQHQQPARDRVRTRRRAVVHQLRQQLDRADHHARGHQLHRHGDQRAAGDRGRARRGAVVRQLWQRSIGRITTSGTVTNYTGTGVSSPYAIAPGPDSALWFTNDGNASIGRITTP